MIIYVRPCQSIKIDAKLKQIVLKKFLFGVSILVNLSEMNYEKGTLHHPCHSLTGPSGNTTK